MSISATYNHTVQVLYIIENPSCTVTQEHDYAKSPNEEPQSSRNAQRKAAGRPRNKDKQAQLAAGVRKSQSLGAGASRSVPTVTALAASSGADAHVTLPPRGNVNVNVPAACSVNVNVAFAGHAPSTFSDAPPHANDEYNSYEYPVYNYSHTFTNTPPFANASHTHRFGYSSQANSNSARLISAPGGTPTSSGFTDENGAIDLSFIRSATISATEALRAKKAKLRKGEPQLLPCHL